MAAAQAATELRGLLDDELVTKLREAKEELFNLRFQSATGQLDNNKRLNTVKKDIARIYTVMRERELGLSSEPAASTSEASAPVRPRRFSRSRVPWVKAVRCGLRSRAHRPEKSSSSVADDGTGSVSSSPSTP